MDRCELGCSAILNVGDTKQELERNFSFVRVVKGKARVGKYSQCEVSNLIGAPWGSFFQLKDNSLVGPLTKAEAYNIDHDALVALAGGSGVNNKTIYGEGNAAQKTDVNLLKEEGADGGQILEKLVENSTTFAQRTKFSQTKFMTQKQRKHAPVVELVKPTGRAVCEAAFAKFSTKTIGIREDSLAQILQLSGVAAGSNAMVIDGTSGLVTGAVAERMGGHGSLLAGTTIQTQLEQGVFQWYNLSKAERSILTQFYAIPHMQPPEEPKQPQPKPVAAAPEDGAAAEDARPARVYTAEELEARAKFIQDKEARREAKRLEDADVLARMDRGLDSLIVCLSAGALEAFWAFLPKLSFGCPFVIYCDFIEPLSAGMHALRSKKCAVRLHLQETWFREYQVLPERSHPVMSTSATSGYILSGVYVDAASTKAYTGPTKRKLEDPSDSAAKKPATQEPTE